MRARGEREGERNEGREGKGWYRKGEMMENGRNDGVAGGVTGIS